MPGSAIVQMAISHIDRSMVDGDFTNDNSGAIVQSITKLAKSLGVKTVGEGAETYEQLLFYVRCGCDYVQGNVFGAPVSEGSFLQLFKERAC